MVGTQVVSAFRRFLSLALVAALTSMSVQAAELHIHARTDQANDSHRHGPASHHHDVINHHSSDTTRIAAVNEDGTVVHVALAAASAQSTKPLQAPYDVAPVFDRGVPSIVDGSPIIARAHGPPSTVQHSLRAPPAILSL